MKKTKIVCTIGPASENKDTLLKLIDNGMNVMRMNFSHGDQEEQGNRIKIVKEINSESNKYIGLMLDTRGPEIRTGYLKNGRCEITQGSKIRVTMDEDYLGDENKIAISYSGLYDDIPVGGKILIEDGNLSLTVLEKDESTKELVCVAGNSRTLKNRKNCNVPGVVLNMEYISEKDYSDILFGIEQDVDFIAASFVRRADDIHQLRNILKDHNKEDILIISKIENQEGVDNMSEIIELSDGVMVARGDLGVDVEAWELPNIQKEMIREAQEMGKIVVTATQMLDSMIVNPRPTRAEVSDVYNSVLEGTSATMLSGETANGDFPDSAVKFMSKINLEAESNLDYIDLMDRALENEFNIDSKHAIAYSASKIAYEFGVSAIISKCNYKFGYELSRYRPAAPVYVAVDTEKEARLLSLAWGVIPVVGSEKDAFEKAKSDLGLSKGEIYLVVTETSLEFKTISKK